MLKTITKVVKPNFVDKTIWTGDNLDILRGLNSETVDLIYLDPPFNSNRNYEAPVGSKAAGAAFKDAWTLSDLDVAWMGLIADEQPAVANLLQTTGLTHGKGMQSYLTMMGVRLLEMRRVLKDTGSIYLHCDTYASHYLKMLMDAVFGARYFKNEIVWRRMGAHNDGKQGATHFGRVHDNLLRYSNGPSPIWNTAYEPYSKAYIDKAYRYREPSGRRYQIQPLHAAKPGGDTLYEWKGRLPPTGRYWAYSQANMQRMESEGKIHYSSTGNPSYKIYLDESRGRPPQDVWDDVAPVRNRRAERTGYPTQKPLALLERIIKVSTNEGDVVLDPFAGCATACVAAEKLDRQWVGIDLSPVAYTLVQERLSREVQVGSKEIPPSDGLDRHTPHGHSAPDGHRRSQELPAAQARLVRGAGRPVQRLPDGLPVQDIHDRPHSSAITWRGRQHREPSASLRSLQQHQRQQAPRVPNGETEGDRICHGLRRNVGGRSKSLTRRVLMPHRSNWRRLSSAGRRTR